MPDDFIFAAKAPKEITHRLHLRDAGVALEEFLEEVAGLGKKLGPLLFQLSPSLAFEPELVRSFLGSARARFDGNVVFEPRHVEWFTPGAEELLTEFRISRVAADPPVAPGAGEPGGWTGLAHFRLHGSPRIYYSEYGPERIGVIARQLARSEVHHPLWCIFDNTAAGAAIADALALQARLRGR